MLHVYCIFTVSEQTACCCNFCLSESKQSVVFSWPVDPHSSPSASSLVLMCPAGQSMNRWSLEELVKRDPENFLILLQQIIRKTREVERTVDTRGRGRCLHVHVWCLRSAFRFRSSASTSWWLLWPSCSSPHCCRYRPSLLCCTLPMRGGEASHAF